MSRYGSKAFALIWLAGVAGVVAAGFSVDGYRLHVMQMPLPHPYPFEGVAAFCGAITVEVALLYAVIRPATYDRSWGRALFAIFVSGAAFLLTVVTMMHAPPYWGAHGLFLFCLTLASMLLFLVSVASRLHGRLRGIPR